MFQEWKLRQPRIQGVFVFYFPSLALFSFFLPRSWIRACLHVSFPARLTRLFFVLAQGMKYPPEGIKHFKKVAILQSETDLHDCAEAFVMFAENGSITGQALTVGKLLNSAASTAPFKTRVLT